MMHVSIKPFIVKAPVSPPEVHNMFRVRVCAANMGGCLSPEFSKQGSLFGRFSLNMGRFGRNSRKWVGSRKINHKSGYESWFV